MSRRPVSRLLPEEHLLLALGKLEPAAADRAIALQASAEADFSWEQVVAMAMAYRVHPIVAFNLEHDPLLWRRVPEDVRGTLRALRAAAAMRNALYTREMTPVLEVLARENIPLALMKGAAIVATLYPSGTRLLNDFDVLIERRHYHQVAALLESHGFTKVFRKGRTERLELDSYHEIVLVKNVGESTLKIDLHWMMYPPDRAFCQIDTSALLARAGRVKFGTTSVHVLSPADILVHYGSQLANDSLRVGFQRTGDIYAVVKSAPPWDSVVEIAIQAGAAGSTHLALSIAASLGAQVPPAVLRRLRRACPGCHLTSRCITGPTAAFRAAKVPGAVKSLLVALLYSRLQDRIEYIRLSLRARWQTSRRHRGLVATCVAAARHIGRAGWWSGGQLTRPVPRGRDSVPEPSSVVTALTVGKTEP